MSSYGQPNLDLADRLASPDTQQHHISTTSGTDTPKDLAARVRIIELFTLHVLPRNEEWEYANEFVNLSEVLDEERKELFLQTLEGLKEEKEKGELRAVELQRAKEAELDRQRDDERRKAEEEAAAARPQTSGHKRNTSENDYGIEKGSSRSATRGKSSKSSDKSPSGKSSSATLSSPGPKNNKKQVRPEPRGTQARAVANSLRNLFKHVLQSVSGNPLSVVRTLLFVLGILMAMSRQDVRERVRRITGSAWQKVKGTVGMGVKVSYI